MNSNIQGIMAQEKITEGSYIQRADTVQQCHFRAALPQQLAHSPRNQGRRTVGLRTLPLRSLEKTRPTNGWSP